MLLFFITSVVGQLLNRFIAFLAIFIPSLAFAHPGHGGGFVHGLLHPLLGIDHILTAFLVGLLATAIGAHWRIPALFLAAAALGYGAASAGLVPATIAVDPAIAVLLALLGGALVIGGRTSALAAFLLITVAGLLHGAAHGAELPADAGTWLFAAGFLGATAALHGAGVAAASLARKLGAGHLALLLRLSGGLSSAAALLILAGAL